MNNPTVRLLISATISQVITPLEKCGGVAGRVGRSKSAAVLLERGMYAGMDEWTGIRKRVLLSASKSAFVKT